MMNAWTYLAPTDTSEIDRLRREIDAATPDRFEPENDPHVSVLPGFELPDDATEEDVEAVLDAGRSHLPDEVRTVGFHTHNPIDVAEDTYVVALDVEADGLEAAREAMIEAVEARGGELLYDPVPAHFTLVKSGDEVNEDSGLTDEEKQRLREAFAGTRSTFTFDVTAEADTF